MDTVSDVEKTQITRARSKFVCMAGSYSMGVFNDQFFKQAAILVALSARHSDYQGYLVAVFTLPYVICAAPAGWLADRFSKGKVVIFAKALEVVAMAFGAAGIVSGNWPLIFAMAFTMGLQSAIFSPSLNGSIPELYPASYVPKANA
ncbi:MAG: MFS transporter, partial [Planctomycetes bacterium]|nr:MFS transporter [Planctomycetota bacterium]